jgi:hypothetical protein
MGHIFFTLLLLATPALFPMNSSQIQPSNSSSEICLFIKNIDNNVSLQSQFPKEIKEKILNIYIIVTDDERKNSEKYNDLINTSDYMNLNQANKCTIQNWGKESKSIKYVSNKEALIFSAQNALQQHDRILNLPHNIRHRLADKYVLLVEKTNKNGKEYTRDDAVYHKNLCLDLVMNGSAAIPYLIGYIIDQYLLSTYPILTGMATIPALLIPMYMRKKYDDDHPLNSELDLLLYNGYTLLPLLPEDIQKYTK